MLLWAMLLLLQDAPVTLNPSSKWQVDASETGCLVIREFGLDDTKIALAFRLIPFVKPYEVMLLGDRSANWRGGELIIAATPNGAQIKRTATLSKTADGRPLLTALLEENDLEVIAQASQLKVVHPDGTVLSGNAVNKAFAAAKACQDDVVRSWGVDPVNAQLKAKPINPSTWVTDDDYPKGALRSRAQGVVVFQLTVDVKGEVAGCRVLKSSGNRELDDTVCRNMRAHGRFTPATTADGTRVASAFISRFTWKIP